MKKILMIETDHQLIDVDHFLGGKTKLARALARGECGGHYDDGILILSSVISTFAAHFWPTPPSDVAKKYRVPDSKRFVEFWVIYGESTANVISVPLLAEELHLEGNSEALDALRPLRPELLRNFPLDADGDVYTGEAADALEAEIVASCPNLKLRQIRRWSYPAVFYREVRSGYVHELNPTERASPFPASHGSHGEVVTYLNSMRRPFRRIHFDVGWLCTTIEDMSRRAYLDWQRSGSRCALRWWIDGD